MLLAMKIERLPVRQIEALDPWKLGGDGKCYWGYYSDSEWYKRFMRK